MHDGAADVSSTLQQPYVKKHDRRAAAFHAKCEQENKHALPRNLLDEETMDQPNASAGGSEQTNDVMPTMSNSSIPNHDCLVHLEQLFARGAVASRHSASRSTPPPPLLPDALHDALEDYNSPPPPPPPHPPHIAPDAQRLAHMARHRLLALKQLQVDQLLSRDEASQVAVNIATALLTQPTHAHW